jgi:hypothetical protein
VLLPLSPQEQAALYGPTEHYDTVVMRKRVAAESPTTPDPTRGIGSSNL